MKQSWVYIVKLRFDVVSRGQTIQRGFWNIFYGCISLGQEHVEQYFEVFVTTVIHVSCKDDVPMYSGSYGTWRIEGLTKSPRPSLTLNQILSRPGKSPDPKSEIPKLDSGTVDLCHCFNFSRYWGKRAGGLGYCVLEFWL